ncbi:Non-homologous end joining protein Ku [bioreactor metagenome]|uniref:Non-homologous end joining protein Ku n=1 Tax=bioreactor metagenome TaxID=1076179 RepID=A0A645GCA8_9ZZZZ
MASQIDPIYYDQSYYLVPDKSAAKAYTLLLAAMKEAKRTAIAKLVIRNKQHLTAIRADNRVLTLSIMHFADEIVAQDELEDLPAADTQPDKREMTIALQLIESLSTDFAPSKYHDEHYDKVLNMIEQKAEGQQVVTQPSAPPTTKVVDLMAALEASLAEIKKEKPAAKTRRKKSRAQ